MQGRNPLLAGQQLSRWQVLVADAGEKKFLIYNLQNYNLMNLWKTHKIKLPTKNTISITPFPPCLKDYYPFSGFSFWLGGCPRMQNKREPSRFKSIINVGVWFIKPFIDAELTVIGFDKSNPYNRLKICKSRILGQPPSTNAEGWCLRRIVSIPYQRDYKSMMNYECWIMTTLKRAS